MSMNKKLKYLGGSQRISCGTKHEKYSQSYCLSSIRCKSNFAVFPIKYLLVIQMRDSNFNSTSAFPATMTVEVMPYFDLFKFLHSVRSITVHCHGTIVHS